MDPKSLLKSSEILTGVGLIIAGITAQTAGFHGIYAMALAPFGIGLILSEGVARAGRAARERVKIRIRHDDK